MKYTVLLLCTALVLITPIIHISFADELNSGVYFLFLILLSIFINGCILFILIRNLKNIFFQRVYLIYILFSFFWLLLYHILAHDTNNPYGGFNLSYDINHFRYYLVWLIPGLVILILYPILKYYDVIVKKALLSQPSETDFARRAVVYVFFLFELIYLIGNLDAEIPLVSYFGRVGHNNTLLFLFWIGYWNKRLGPIFYLTLMLVMTIAVFELLAGSRYGPVFTVFLLLLGYYFSAGHTLRRRLWIVSIIAFPFVVFTIGYLDSIRQLIGRGGMEEVSLERVEQITYAMKKIESANKVLRRKESAFVSGVARNINWVDVAVISLTDDKIPFRGTRNLDTELNNILTLTLFSSGGSTREVIDEARLNKYSMELGTAPARKYGFSVNARTSSEWSLLSDAYSRGGHFVFCLYLGVFMFIMSSTEVLIRKFINNQAEQKLLLSVFLYIIIKANALPLYELIREFILNTGFYFFIILMLRFFTGRKLFS